MTEPRSTATLARILFSPDGATTLGYEFVDAGSPQLLVTDVAATRGDGVFETISVGSGLPQALNPHLDRFAKSAALLDLPHPDLGVWRAAVHEAAATMADHDEAQVKLVLSRGVEGQPAPTGWVYASVAPDYRATRTIGIGVVLLDRGLAHNVAQTSPWLLAGAKTLSYAVNLAALREARRRGADDVVFVSSDGFLLEGPVSNLIIRRGMTLSTPRTDLGILTGTTQSDVFAWAESQGFATEQALLTPSDLTGADAAWLVSSVRHAAPLHAIDGSDFALDGELTAGINAALRARTG
ncbi:MAG TPA: aminotransferase class IV [Pseudolysinimonas sp.]|nr:aminotransferase class IV [Pseudolysinimonas sp.]